MPDRLQPNPEGRASEIEAYKADQNAADVEYRDMVDCHGFPINPAGRRRPTGPHRPFINDLPIYQFGHLSIAVGLINSEGCECDAGCRSCARGNHSVQVAAAARGGAVREFFRDSGSAARAAVMPRHLRD